MSNLTKRVCWCQKWQKYSTLMDNAFTYRLIEGGEGFEDVAFQICPWCGVELGRVQSNVPTADNPITAAMDEQLLKKFRGVNDD